MATYTTLEEIKTGTQTVMFGADLIKLRPEQRDAIDRAKERFCDRSGRKPDYVYTVRPDYRQFLWNAKMRFGKTICALQLAREMDVKRTLIVTHRPVVSDSWLKAFKQVFGTAIEGNSDVIDKYGFGTRSETDNQGNYYDLEKFVKTEGNHYVFFVSMQYLRLSELVNAKTQAKHGTKEDDTPSNENEKLKADILKTDWDLVVIDEAHEGTRTALGECVIKDFLKKEKTKMLHLSGTPFNLYEDFESNEIFTWDYISEQQAKHQWEIDHPGEKNPYADLPKMNMLTYDITKNINQVLDQEGVFTFNEFFRTWTGNPKADRATMPEGAKGRFVHETEVNKFLDLLCTKDAENNFPFSTDEYRKIFRHTFWVVSGVKEAKALETLLNEHPKLGHGRFKVINVAGEVETDEQNENALDKVINTIGQLPEQTSTITISCGRLTTGVTVEPWSAVLYLKGGDRAATYMQTIFRVQSPYKTPDGKMKTSCYVFDFSPDRTIKVVAETAKFSSLTKKEEAKKDEGDEEKTQEMRDKETVQEFVKLCPVISMEGGMMSPLNVNDIYKQLENVFIDRLVRKGFDDSCLYNMQELNKLDPNIINHIGMNGGQAPDETRKEAKETVDLSHMTPEQRAEWEAKIAEKMADAKKKAEEKLKKEEAFIKWWESASDEEREKWLRDEAEKAAKREKAKQEREEFRKRITNIRGIALRIPLLMYGGADAGDSNDDITVENFTRKIKDESWAEFMPKGISKEDFNKIKRCFNATRFMEAGRKYRALTREADFMHVEERIKLITEIFSYFHNPDKETVLTPWRVVNMHLSDTLGGWCFFDETFDEKKGQIEQPRFVDQGEVTRELFDNVDAGGEVQTKILEINSKTGLYPLYVTYSLYRRRLQEYIKAECINPETISVQEEQVVWDDIVADNIFVICNTPMAVGITKRTLFGFRQVEKKANIKAAELVNRAINDQDSLISELKSEGFWKGTRSKNMIEFNAVVGNPPYQLKTNTTGFQGVSIYQTFIETACCLSPNYVSMITPSRWMTKGSMGVREEWVDKMLQSNHFIKIEDFLDFSDCFKGVGIGGGVNYFLYSKNYTGPCHYVLHQDGSTYVRDKELDEIGAGVVIRDGRAYTIIEKIVKEEGRYFNEKNFSSMVGPLHFFDRDETLGTNWRGYSKVKDDAHPVKCYINKRLETCGYGWIQQSDIAKNHATIPLHKVFLPKAYGTAGDPNVIGVPFYGEPNSACSFSYIVIGYCPEKHNFSKEECEHIISYMKTKFFRYMITLRKKTQDNPAPVFQFVPMQDFSKSWTDKELYEKYQLEKPERDYIESMINPMK